MICWAVKLANGYIFSETVRHHMQESIAAFLKDTDLPWLEWQEDFKVRCVKVKIEEVE